MLFADPSKDFKELQSENYHKVWEPFMRKYHCDKICELGVFKGDNFMQMIKHQPKLAVAVDSWKNEGVHSPRDASYSKKELKSQYLHFTSLVKDLSFVKILRMPTQKAVAEFPNNYFDFVYVDADHSAKACYKDLLAWYPKVKRGKFLVGHDYQQGFGVVDAVNRFVKEKKLALTLLPPSNWMVVKV